MKFLCSRTVLMISFLSAHFIVGCQTSNTGKSGAESTKIPSVNPPLVDATLHQIVGSCTHRIDGAISHCNDYNYTPSTNSKEDPIDQYCKENGNSWSPDFCQIPKDTKGCMVPYKVGWMIAWGLSENNKNQPCPSESGYSSIVSE